MRERHVICGASQIGQPAAANALHLDCRAPLGSPARVNLVIDDLSKRLADNIPRVLVDLLEVAAYVYCADQLTSRGSAKLKDMGAEWRRAFRFQIPVREPAIWQQPPVIGALTETLSFLSEDEFTFEFAPATNLPLLQGYLGLENPSAHVIHPDEVILFSGGLDSLAGTVDAVLGHSRKALLVSHRGSPMVAAKQTALVGALATRTPGSLFHVPVQVNKGSEEAKDFTQRTRSFLFATLGFIVARMFGLKELSFYENGIVSINLPVSENVVGSRASRTTHPQALAGFGRLFSRLIDQEFTLLNPYLWKTKADVVRVLVEQGSAHLIADTFSCASVREATKTRKHCGVCSQCLDRRFGILAAGVADKEPVGNYAIELFNGPRKLGPSTTMAVAYVERALKLTSMSEQSFLPSYGQIFRVLPFLPGSPDENVHRLWQLHRRHGAEVVSATNSELAARSSLDQLIDLAPNTLLAMLRNATMQQFVYEDPGAKEPPASQQVIVLPSKFSMHHLTFAVDPEQREVLFLGGIVFRGQIFELVDALFGAYQQDRDDGKVPDWYRFTTPKGLARRLGVEEPTVRKRLARARHEITQRLSERLAVHVDENSVIENKRWKGYRLNPDLILGKPKQLRAGASMSQLAHADVPTPMPAH